MSDETLSKKEFEALLKNIDIQKQLREYAEDMLHYGTYRDPRNEKGERLGWSGEPI